MAENKPVKSKRDQHLERMRKRYPEKRFEDDEEIFGLISDDYDQFEQENSTMKAHEKAFSDLFSSNPRSARLMMEWKDGKDPVASLIRIYGKDEILGAIDDPSRLDAIEEANKEFAERLAKSDELEREYNQNLPQSLQEIETWAKAEGVGDEEIDTSITRLSKICADFMTGKIQPATISMLLKASGYDRAVAEAREEGEVAGRNAKIKENLRRSKKGDGLQTLNGRNGTPSRNPSGHKSIFDLAREAD